MNGKLRNMTSLYISKGGKILLLKRQGSRIKSINGMWVASAGGHFEDFEINDAASCVFREANEELGLTPDMLRNLRLRYITLRSVGGEIRQNYYFFADLADGVDHEFYSCEGELKWYDIFEIPSLPMPFTAKYVMEHYLSQGINDTLLYAGIANDRGVSFLPLIET